MRFQLIIYLLFFTGDRTTPAPAHAACTVWQEQDQQRRALHGPARGCPARGMLNECGADDIFILIPFV